MTKTTDVVKRGRKKTEPFEYQKLNTSIVAVCRSLKIPEGEVEIIANDTCNGVLKWLENRAEVTSQDLRINATKHLQKRCPEAAYLYEQYHLII